MMHPGPNGAGWMIRLNKPMNKSLNKIYLLYLTVLFSVLLVLNLPAIAQDPAYHQFADQRQILAIANFFNVISNLPFILVSVIAVSDCFKIKCLNFKPALSDCYRIFFLAIGGVGIGSGYYHLNPANNTLFWDRLPMSIAFMAFFVIIIAEFISLQIARKLFYPLILIGMVSVVYWYLSEQFGHGDLRLYALVQFLPMLLIPMILFMFPARYNHNIYLWAMLVCYLMAKLVEFYDVEIYNMIGLSGHTIKHLLAAFGPYLFYLQLKKRKAVRE